MALRLTASLFDRTTDADERHLPDILRQETVGGMLMLAAAVVALLWANLAPGSYEAVAHAKIGPLSVAHWMSDGLLTIFFFVAGLELKREFAEGALRRPASALVPVVAAVLGMALPALLYVAVNVATPGGALQGWAIPMATDIAFALAVLAIVGSDLSPRVRSFLLTLAIVDDLGAIIIIALFFAKGITWWALAAAVAAIAAWALLQRLRVRSLWIYAPLGVLAWWFMLQSGVHATIAGVALGVLVRTSLAEDHDTLDVWEHALRPWSAGLVVPAFALFAAGVHLDVETLRRVVTSPVAWGILAGLVLGKLLGVFAGAVGTARLTGTHNPQVKWSEVAGAAQLAGIGFTVSLLLTELAFAGDPDRLAEGKAAVLLASLVSALVGGLVLRRRNHVHRAERLQAERAAKPDATH